MNTPDNCYADKSHSAHDLMAPGEKCKHCGFVQVPKVTVRCSGCGQTVVLYDESMFVTDLHRRALEACEEYALAWDSPQPFSGKSPEDCRQVGRESLAARKPKPPRWTRVGLESVGQMAWREVTEDEAREIARILKLDAEAR